MSDPAHGTENAAADAARMAVILVSPRGLAGMQKTLAALARQTVARRLELMLVGPAGTGMNAGALEDPSLLLRFGRVCRIERPAIENVDHAMVHGLAEVAAPLVASIEDHAFPEPAWAEQTLAAWDAAPASCAAIGFGITNANPEATLSWANMLLAYGRWMPPAAGDDRPGPGEVTSWVAAHNVSLRTDALRGFGDRLAGLTGREGLFLHALKDGGAEFRMAMGARVAHVNPSTLWATAKLRTDAGRLYAARRARDAGWSVAKRAAYVVLSPVIPLLRFRRERANLFGGGRFGELTPRVYPSLLLALGFDGLGQALGFAAGPGKAAERLATFEMDRREHVTAADRERCFA